MAMTSEEASRRGKMATFDPTPPPQPSTAAIFWTRSNHFGMSLEVSPMTRELMDGDLYDVDESSVGWAAFIAVLVVVVFVVALGCCCM